MNLLSKLKKSLSALSPNCREASRLQSEALDRPLSPIRKVGFNLHLLLCKWCRRYGKQIRFLRCAAHDPAHEEQLLPPQTLSADARERIKRRIQAEEK
jgi:predicted anti-sigma-YlaC factor YlaD